MSREKFLNRYKTYDSKPFTINYYFLAQIKICKNIMHNDLKYVLKTILQLPKKCFLNVERNFLISI